MYSQLYICPLQIACLYKICNSVDVASATVNMLCTTVSVVSVLISHYPGLLIGGSALPCLFYSPIFLQIYHILHPMVLIICMGCESTSCSLEPDLDYQSFHHQVLSQSNGNISHFSIKLMDSRVISTLDRWRCAWDSALNNIDVSMII